jgi:hypothetical protein
VGSIRHRLCWFPLPSEHKLPAYIHYNLSLVSGVIPICRIRVNCKCCHLLGHSAVQSVREQTFRRNVPSPSSWSKFSRDRNQSVTGGKSKFYPKLILQIIPLQDSKGCGRSRYSSHISIARIKVLRLLRASGHDYGSF